MLRASICHSIPDRLTDPTVNLTAFCRRRSLAEHPPELKRDQDVRDVLVITTAWSLCSRSLSRATMSESHTQKTPSMQPGIPSTSDLTIPRADSSNILAHSLEEVSTTTSTTVSPSATPAPTISQLPSSIPTSTQTKPLAPADNKPSSSSSQSTPPPPDGPTKPIHIPENTTSTSATPSVLPVISATVPALTTCRATVGPTFKNTTLQDSTKLSETTAPTRPNPAASITPTEISVSAQQTNNTHPSIIDSSNPFHDRVHRPLPPVPALDYIVPYESKIHVKSVEERMLPTIIAAEVERKKYAERAMMKGYTMNIAIGIQLLAGALTTAISALVTGREITIVLPVLGGISTLAAAFLTKVRGSNELEGSLMVAKDLEQFIRECKGFLVDFGSSTEDIHRGEVQRLRNRFEEILSLNTDVEKR
ncbi:hypothetical protein F5146DRAFT_1226754 [Armillaria mellea]|nr:hypothetical protein F5146DRAFT_1226754 [Armillaria mellea]